MKILSKVYLFEYKNRVGMFLEGKDKTVIFIHGLGGNFYENKFIHEFLNIFPNIKLDLFP
jgi:predicted esterase